jgi:hypothetical protein
MTVDPRWELLQVATPLLRDHFADRGVVRVEYVAAFSEADSFSVWLCTRTDAQRDALRTEGSALGAVRRLLREAGFTEREVSRVGTTSQSQETVDRDYAGSWFYALR